MTNLLHDDSEIARLKASLKQALDMNELLKSRIEFWRNQATAAQRRKADLYSMLMSLRVQIDQAFGDQPEEATQK